MTGSVLMACLAAAMSLASPAEKTSGLAEPAPQRDRYDDNACVQCHQDLPGKSSEIVELQWKQSVHYGANVGCDGCHGGNPAVRPEQFDSADELKRAAHQKRNPEFLTTRRSGDGIVTATGGRSVSYFCGKCHDQIKEKHLGSPHGDFGDPTCLYCHGQGSHKITDATPQIIDTAGRAEAGRCSPCHEASTMTVVRRIKQTLTDTEQRIGESGELYAELESWGYRNLELEQLHHHAREVYSKLRQIFHSFNMREIDNFAAEIQQVADRTTETYEMIKRQRAVRRQQTVMGLLAVCLLLSFAGLLVYYKHNFLDPLHART
jgi:Cytochrome c554 and c-prime